MSIFHRGRHTPTFMVGCGSWFGLQAMAWLIMLCTFFLFGWWWLLQLVAAGTSTTHCTDRICFIHPVPSLSHSQCHCHWIADVCVSCGHIHSTLHITNTHLCWSSNCGCICHRDNCSHVHIYGAFCHRFELLNPLLEPKFGQNVATTRIFWLRAFSKQSLGLPWFHGRKIDKSHLSLSW